MASWGSLIAEGADQMNPIRILLVADCLPRRRAGFDVAGADFLGDGLRDAVGCAERKLTCASYGCRLSAASAQLRRIEITIVCMATSVR